MMRPLTILMALAVTSALALAGCVDNDGNSPGDVAADLCHYYQDCYPTDFEQEWGTIQSCISEMEAQLEQVRSDYGLACYNAGVDALDCQSSLDCGTDPETPCAAEIARAEAECEDPPPDSPCPGYVPGSDDDYCCQTDDPCDWANDEFCDCDGTCSWDALDCG